MTRDRESQRCSSYLEGGTQAGVLQGELLNLQQTRASGYAGMLLVLSFSTCQKLSLDQ